MLKKIFSYVLPVLLIFPLFTSFVETVDAAENTTEVVQPKSVRVHKKVTRLYPNTNNVPQTILHREFINNFRYDGTLTLTKLVRNSSGTYVGTYEGYIYKTPIMENSIPLSLN